MTQGEMLPPLSDKLVTMLVHLEQGRASIFHDSMALFCKKREGAYHSGYFSTHVGEALTFDGVRFGARGMRGIQNSLASRDVAYDEALIVRGAQHSIALWPKFEQFVHAHHMLAMSGRDVSPLTLEL